MGLFTAYSFSCRILPDLKYVSWQRFICFAHLLDKKVKLGMGADIGTGTTLVCCNPLEKLIK